MSVEERGATVEPSRRGSVLRQSALAVPLVLVTLILAAAAGVLAQGSAPFLALLFPVMLVPALVWLRPRSVLYLLFAAAVVIEQFAYEVAPDRAGAVTSQIPLFHGILPAGTNPAELLLLMGMVVVLMQAVQRREPWLYRTTVQRLMLGVTGFVVLYLMVGLARGGNLTMALWEVRPFFYLLGTYLLAAALITRFSEVRPLLWIMVVGSGVKAVYGLTIFMSVRHMDPRPEAVLAHEESFFLGVYIIATAAMWLFRFRDPLRLVATLLLPLVLLCDMVNSRRTAWLILISGLLVVMVIALVQRREQRKTVAVVMVVSAVAAAVYFPLFWNKDGTLAQPARAVRSAVAPDERDRGSNDYRDIENFNLQFYIGMDHSTGHGFGRPIQYFGLVDLLEISPMLAYVPHNGVLYVWWRMGFFGVTVFAVMVGQGVISGARLAAARRPEVAMMGAFTAAAIFGYVAMGGTDMGFFWFRNAIAMGTLMGVVDGLARGARTEREREVAELEGAQAGATTRRLKRGRALTGVVA